ncbi:MAG: hypothetical protein ABFE07_13870 [Armatimonadia bacterium]
MRALTGWRGYAAGFLSASVIGLALLIGWRYWTMTPSYNLSDHTWRSATVYWRSKVLADITSQDDLRKLQSSISWYHADEGDGMMGRCGEGNRFFVRLEGSGSNFVDLELPIDSCLHVNVLHGHYGFYAPQFLQTLGAMITDEALRQKTWLTQKDRAQLVEIIHGWRYSKDQARP